MRVVAGSSYFAPQATGKKLKHRRQNCALLAPGWLGKKYFPKNKIKSLMKGKRQRHFFFFTGSVPSSTQRPQRPLLVTFLARGSSSWRVESRNFSWASLVVSLYVAIQVRSALFPGGSCLACVASVTSLSLILGPPKMHSTGVLVTSSRSFVAR